MPEHVRNHFRHEEKGSQRRGKRKPGERSRDDAPWQVERAPAATQHQDRPDDRANPPCTQREPANEITGEVMAKLELAYFRRIPRLKHVRLERVRCASED